MQHRASMLSVSKKWVSLQSSEHGLHELVPLRLFGSVLAKFSLHLGIASLDRLVLAIDTLNHIKVIQRSQNSSLVTKNVALEPPRQPCEDLVPHKGAGGNSKDCMARQQF